MGNRPKTGGQSLPCVYCNAPHYVDVPHARQKWYQGRCIVCKQYYTQSAAKRRRRRGSENHERRAAG